MAKTVKEIEGEVEVAQAFLNQRSLAADGGSRTDPVAVRRAEDQKAAFVSHFQDWSSDDLLKLQSAMLKDFDAQLSRLQEQGNAQRGTPTRNAFDTKMKNVFQNLVTTMNEVRKSEGATVKAELVEVKPEETVSPTVSQQSVAARENRLVAVVKNAAARIQAAVERVKDRFQRKQDASPADSTPDPARQAKIDAAVLAWAEGTSEKAVNTLEKSIEQTTAKIEKEDIADADIDALVADLNKMPEPVDKEKNEASSKFDIDHIFDEMVKDGKIDPTKAAPPMAEQALQEHFGENNAKPNVEVVPPKVSTGPAPAQLSTAAQKKQAWQNIKAVTGAVNENPNTANVGRPLPPPPPPKPTVAVLPSKRGGNVHLKAGGPKPGGMR